MTMMSPAQKASHDALVLDGLNNQEASLRGELREQRGKLERSLRLAGIDPIWGNAKYAEAAATKIEQLKEQLRLVVARIHAMERSAAMEGV